MDKNSLLQLKQKFNTFHDEFSEQVAQNAANYNELIALWQELHEEYLTKTAVILQQWAESYEQLDNLDRIEADMIMVEVNDQKTGKVFRRKLPVKYVETVYGVILSGETLEGKPSQITLLSEFACGKIEDVTGRGADSPRDHNH